jgi:4,5-dihydroxyphthalate decarboxylase
VPETTLLSALDNYRHTLPFKDRRVGLPGYRLQFIDFPNITHAFRRQCRAGDLDVSEIALSTYLAARAYAKPFTALPVVVARQFPQSKILINTRSGIQSPKDLEGKRVGMRAYTVTTGVWGKGVLAAQYGVDLDSITWVLADEEHVAEFQHPTNVIKAIGANLAEMLAQGELDAAIGVAAPDSAEVRPLFEDAAAAERSWFDSTHVYPINHVVVIKDALTAKHPELPQVLYDAFLEARTIGLRDLETEGPLHPMEREMVTKISIVGHNFLPYGMPANRDSLSMTVDFAVNQKILRRRQDLGELFLPVSA